MLRGGEHAGRTYRLSGPEATGFQQAAHALGVEYVDVPAGAAREGLAAAGLPGWLVEQLDGAFGLIRTGALADVTGTVRALSGATRAPLGSSRASRPRGSRRAGSGRTGSRGATFALAARGATR